MKTLLILLTFIPLAAAAQDKPKVEKPSTTDCPTWQSKPTANKASYYEQLRHTKAKPQDPQLAAVPKKEKPVKAPVAKTEKAYVPSFSAGSDKVMDKSSTPAVAATPEVKANKEPAVKAAAPKEETTAKEAATTSEKKPVKKKRDHASSGKVKGTNKSASKCPAF